MRLWHKDMIPCLPKKQLLGQWRECCLIASSISANGTPNHLLVNKVLDYPAEHFISYCKYVHDEMNARGYQCDWSRLLPHIPYKTQCDHPIGIGVLFSNWHNDRYLKQCFYNLEEKYDCGGIPQDEWVVVKDFYYSSTHH